MASRYAPRADARGWSVEAGAAAERPVAVATSSAWAAKARRAAAARAGAAPSVTVVRGAPRGCWKRVGGTTTNA